MCEELTPQPYHESGRSKFQAMGIPYSAALVTVIAWVLPYGVRA
jgi:hypothetical protein